MDPDVLQKARRYCAAQEHCHQEVRDKLYDWGLHRTEVEQAIGQLIGEGYLDEQRFAEHYALSKFRQKGWGKVKIRAALQFKKVSGPCITLGLKAIDTDEYVKALEAAVRKQSAKEKEPDPRLHRQRIMRYFLGKGFEGDLIERALDSDT